MSDPIKEAVAILRSIKGTPAEIGRAWIVAGELEALLKQEPAAWCNETAKYKTCTRDSATAAGWHHKGALVSKLYATPVSAEPVNARLLDEMKKAREEMSCGNFNSASERITHAIATAEQAKPAPGEYYGIPLDDGLPAPELTDEQVFNIWMKCPEFETLQESISWLAKEIQRKLRGEGK